MEDTTSQQSAITDAGGFYSLSRLFATSTSVTASRPGYVTDTRRLTISGDTQLDIVIGRVATYVLSGVVYEVTATGPAPVEGVNVYCDSCGSPNGHTFTATNADGYYSFAWARNGTTPIIVWKQGYGELTAVATVNGDTRFDVQVIRH